MLSLLLFLSLQSGQQAIHFAAQAIAAGDMDCVIAAGVEMMGRVQMGSDW